MGIGYMPTDLALEIEETGWSQRIETGIEALDAQHRQYFDLVNDYLSAAATMTADSDRISDLGKKLDYLRRYAIEHFATEQKIMKDAGYEGYQAHFEEHMYFLRHVGALHKQLCDEGHNDKLAREVYFYTLEWFTTHIQSADMKVVDFLKQDSVPAKAMPGF